MKDKDREAKIDAAYWELQAAKTPKKRQKAWKKMQVLVNGRSPEQIRKMEEEKGLKNGR